MGTMEKKTLVLLEYSLALWVQTPPVWPCSWGREVVYASVGQYWRDGKDNPTLIHREEEHEEHENRR